MRTLAKTKILCTLGPATSSAAMIESLIMAGMYGIRLNFSHGSYDFYDTLFGEIEKTVKKTNHSLAILLDLQGPKIRIGELSEPVINIETGGNLEITIDDILGTKEIVSTSYKPLVNDCKVGEPILINDGLIRLTIIEKKERSVVCYIDAGGELKPKKGMNLPGMKLSTPSITEKDFRDIDYILTKRVDYIALSFVRSADDIITLKKYLADKGSYVPVIAKIEKKEALDDIDAILDVTDGIMVARGDLGVELPPHEVPVIQKKLIKKCNEIGKPVITATQMLETMIENPVPTRAEASDVANAVWDGTDVVMLSGETSVGKYPVKAVKMMNDIVCNAEQNPAFWQGVTFRIPKVAEDNLFDSVGNAIVSISKQINAKVIVVFTIKGRTARVISKYRPKCKIIAFSNDCDTMSSLCMTWGVSSYYMSDIDKEKLAIDKAKEILVTKKIVEKGDYVIFTAGAPGEDRSRVNWLNIIPI